MYCVKLCGRLRGKLGFFTEANEGNKDSVLAKLDNSFVNFVSSVRFNFLSVVWLLIFRNLVVEAERLEVVPWRAWNEKIDPKMRSGSGSTVDVTCDLNELP